MNRGALGEPERVRHLPKADRVPHVPVSGQNLRHEAQARPEPVDATRCIERLQPMRDSVDWGTHTGRKDIGSRRDRHQRIDATGSFGEPGVH